MTDADHLRARLAAIGLSQRGLARALGMNERTIRDYVSGEIDPVPAHVWRWLDDAVAPPPAGSTADDDRDEACADAMEPHLSRLLSRAQTAGWHETEITTAIFALAVSHMRARSGDRPTRDTLQAAILMLDE